MGVATKATGFAAIRVLTALLLGIAVGWPLGHIWIGMADDLGKGYGETMMRRAFQLCFAEPAVDAIVIDPLASNTRAHKFYQRLGFVPEIRQRFGDDDCLVHRLARATWRARFPED